MKTPLIRISTILGILILVSPAVAQKAPEVGYVFPAGGKAGTTIEVHLGGYDWTPDMEFFVRDPRIQLIAQGTPGPLLIPGPPYWFGAKGRLGAPPIPREISAKFVILADIAPGPIYWQAANANGCTSTGVFLVGSGPEMVEDEKRQSPQLVASLPTTVSGRLMKIEEVDRYRFVALKDGPVTCDLMARRLGAKFLGIVEVRDSTGKLVADAAGTDGVDPIMTFAAKAGTEYVVAVHDIDFGGDRSYVYRLSITAGPRVVGAFPAVGRRGETREVEFVGIGIASGVPKLESVKRTITFPKDAAASSFDYRLETSWGAAPSFRMPLSDLPELVGSPRQNKATEKLQVPGAVTGVLDQLDAEDGYLCDWKKGEVWSLSAQARRIGSPLDVALTIIGPDGKELAHNDDLPETTDAGLEFTVPADGTYRIVVSDTAGKSGTRSAIYRLVVRPAVSDFSLQIVAPRTGVPIGDRGSLAVKAIRKGGFKGPINLTVSGLPDGFHVHPVQVIAADKTDAIINIHADRDAPTTAGWATVQGTSGNLTRTALARTSVNLAPLGPDEGRVSSILVAGTLKPLFTGRPVDADTGRKVHRGSTFPAEVIVERLEGFNGEITLQMAAQQSYQVQGITGGDVMVPPGVSRTIYPCFMPEWLETSRTSRMGMIAIAKVPDGRGKIRYVANEIKGFITMTMEGALLKVSTEERELAMPIGQEFDVHLKVSRVTKLAEPVRLDLVLPDDLAGLLKAEPVTLAVGKETTVLRVTPAANLFGTHTFTIRATAIQEGKYPVISETSVTVEFPPTARAPR